MERHAYRTFQAVCLITLLLLGGCSAAPSKEALKKVILDHFESPYYLVTDIVVGIVQKIPADKTKTGALGYVVNIPSITLEFTQDTGEPLNYKTGFHLTYNNVDVRIEESEKIKGNLVVTNVSGMKLF
jgi:hypothetical protein